MDTLANTDFRVFLLLLLFKVAPCYGEMLIDISLTSATPSADITCTGSDQQIILESVSHPSQECMDQAYLQFSRQCVREASCTVTAADVSPCDLDEGDVVISASCVESSQIVDICDPPADFNNYPVVYIVSDRFPEMHRGKRMLADCTVKFKEGGQASYKILFLSLTTRADGDSCYDRLRAYEDNFQMAEYCGPSVSAIITSPPNDTKLFYNISFALATTFSGNGFVVKVNSASNAKCSSAPCMNGGSCEEDTSGYSCQCLSGFSGKDCEIGSADMVALMENVAQVDQILGDNEAFVNLTDLYGHDVIADFLDYPQYRGKEGHAQLAAREKPLFIRKESSNFEIRQLCDTCREVRFTMKEFPVDPNAPIRFSRVLQVWCFYFEDLKWKVKSLVATPDPQE